MNILVIMMTMMLAVTMATGCSKKKAEQEPEDRMNAGVVMENVVALPEENMEEPQQVQYAANSQSSEYIPQEPVAVPAAVAVEKPTNKQIQQALKNAGLYHGKLDGDLGPKTKKAIEVFQSRNNLKVDGKVGRRTWAVLAPYLNMAPESLTVQQEYAN